MKTIQMQKERAAFLDYWCEDVPDYMRDKWRESVNELLDTPNAHDKLQAAWDAWQARASILNQNATCEPTAWAVFWGIGEVRPNSVHFEKQTAENVAAQIKSYTELRPLFEHFPKQEPVGIVMGENGVKVPALFTDSATTLQECDLLYAQPVADKQDASRYRSYRKLMDKPVDDWPEGVALARTPEALDAALDAGLKCK